MSNLYQSLLKEFIIPYLKNHQFIRRGSKFYRDLGEIIWLIDFQKSRSNTKELTSFTINLGVFSKTISGFYGDKSLETKFIQDDCHIKKRIGYLMKENTDVWFTIEHNTSLEIFGKEICGLLETAAIPFLSQYKYDNSLYKFWVSGEYGGNTKLGRLHYLLILAVKFGDKNQISEILEEFKKNSSLNFGTSRLLQKLGLNEAT